MAPCRVAKLMRQRRFGWQGPCRSLSWRRRRSPRRRLLSTPERLGRGDIMTAELEAYALLVSERTREDEPGSLLSRPEMR
jgi:hypothetical protein